MKYLLLILILLPAKTLAQDYYDRRSPQGQVVAQPEVLSPEQNVDDAYSPYRGVPEQVLQQPVYPAYELEVPEEIAQDPFDDEFVEEELVEEVVEQPPIEQKGVEAAKAKLQVLDKISTEVVELDVIVGENSAHGSLGITLERCIIKPVRGESLAYLVVNNERKEGAKPLFRGWMLSANPALNSFEHPIFDIILLGCSNDEAVEQKLFLLLRLNQLASLFQRQRLMVSAFCQCDV